MRTLIPLLSLAICLSIFPIMKGKADGKTADPIHVANAEAASTDSMENIPLYSLEDLGLAVESGNPARIALGTTDRGRRIDAWYFPGVSGQRALVTGGVHGSELSSIEVANALIAMLKVAERPYYSVIVIPSLFPDNAANAGDRPEQAGSVLNIGRYSHDQAIDPNRQMPSPGKAFEHDRARDHVGRIIELENQLLLRLIEAFRPARIANLHAIRDVNFGGIYADPRTDHRGRALGYDSDSSLAVDMATYVFERGGNVAGNLLLKGANALYYKDPMPVRKGDFQKRNMSGSALNAGRGAGVSMGTWGTTAIQGDPVASRNRDAMRVLTLEFPGSKRPKDLTNPADRLRCVNQVRAFAMSLYYVFLGKYHVEV